MGRRDVRDILFCQLSQMRPDVLYRVPKIKLNDPITSQTQDLRQLA
jgi:hypothetical protein